MKLKRSLANILKVLLGKAVNIQEYVDDASGREMESLGINRKLRHQKYLYRIKDTFD